MNFKTMLITLGCALGLLMNAGDAAASKRALDDDLRLYSVNLSKNTFHLAELVNYSVTVSNTFMDHSTKNVFIEMYVSDDAILSADDSRFSTPFDDTKAVVYGTSTINVSDYIAGIPENQGNKYLIFVVDYDDRVAEQSEWNNTVAIPVTITAIPSDMELRSMSAPSIVSYNQTFSVPFSWIHNDANSRDLTFTKFYLSTDANFSTNDLYIGFFSLGQMQGNTLYHNTAYINIYNTNNTFNWPTGNYYIIGVAQYFGGYNVEANQNNNFKISPIRVER